MDDHHSHQNLKCLRQKTYELEDYYKTYCQRASENPQASVRQIPAVPRQTSNEKETQICHRFVQTIGLLSWLSVCVLTIWYFRPFSNAGLQFPRDSSSPYPVSTTQQSILRENRQFNVITHDKFLKNCGLQSTSVFFRATKRTTRRSLHKFRTISGY